eukprot:756346-Hanusia_phi.AAC.6
MGETDGLDGRKRQRLADSDLPMSDGTFKTDDSDDYQSSWQEDLKRSTSANTNLRNSGNDDMPAWANRRDNSVRW